MEVTEETRLIKRILKGEQRLYEQLVDRHKDFAYTLAYKITGQSADAEEVTQDAMVKAYFSLKRFNHQSLFSTWLYKIVFNTAVSYKRKKRISLVPSDSTVLNDNLAPADCMEKEERSHFIGQALETLNESDRNLINLYYMKDLPLREVATIMDSSTDAVKVKLFRARQRLGTKLKLLLKEEAMLL